jgi:LmbE family N-acetylglucosaminyl deacetylase
MIMKWIFLSPHLDDAVFSCGGLIWDLTHQGEDVEIWTICTANPHPDNLSPFAISLHADWGLGADAYQIRQTEDQTAARTLNAKPQYLGYLDCIYRQSPAGEFYYQNEEDIFGGLHGQDSELIDQLSEELRVMIPRDSNLVAPLGIGNHVDHDLTRKAVSRLDLPCFYYADFPYAREEDGREIIRLLGCSDDWNYENRVITELGLRKWIEASAAYASQLPIFWEDSNDLENEIIQFSKKLEGINLWKTVPGE